VPSETYDAVVVGAGPAGLVSALYLGRFRRKTLVLHAGSPRASWIPRTQNLLGYRGGISGRELLLRLQRQAMDVGVEFVQGQANVWVHSSGFRISAFNAGSSPTMIFSSKRVILATGIDDIQPEITNLERLRRLGLLRYCPICDAYEYRDQPIAIFVRDRHGLRAAQFLSAFSDHISLILQAPLPLSELKRFQKTSPRHRVFRSKLVSAEPLRRGTQWALRLKFADGAKADVRAAYVELGFRTIDSAFADLKQLQRAKDGRLITDAHGETSIRGLYAVGDCVDGLAQIVVGAGQAAVAATALHNSLRT